MVRASMRNMVDSREGQQLASARDASQGHCTIRRWASGELATGMQRSWRGHGGGRGRGREHQSSMGEKMAMLVLVLPSSWTWR